MRPHGEPPSQIRVDNLFCIIQTVYTREKNTREKTQEKKHKRKNTREKTQEKKTAV